MVFTPRSTTDVYESIRDELTSRISKLTNFVPGSFNNAFLLSYSDQIRESEIKALASELAGYVDYAGKTLTEEDLRLLGVDNVDPSRINLYMDDRQLDFLAENYGLDRDLGTRAFGDVILTAGSDTTVTNGMVVGTEPDSNGDFKEYYINASSNPEAYDPQSDKTIDLTVGDNEVPVVAEDVGAEYNVGAGSIVYMPNPESGVQDISNTDPIDGGEGEESNAELRGRIKESLFSRSDGGTELGISSYIKENAQASVDINIDEFTSRTPPFVDVVVDGGDTATIESLIDDSRPVGIEHNLVRPNRILLDLFTTVTGESGGIDTSVIEGELDANFEDLNLGDQFSPSNTLNTIITSQSTVNSVPALNLYIHSSDNEQIEYQSGTSTYGLNEIPLGTINEEEHYYDDTTTIYQLFYDKVDGSSVVVRVVQDDGIVTLDPSTDFNVIDDDGDGDLDSIDLDSGVSIDEGTTIRFDYEHNNFDVISVVGEDGTSYTESTDYGLIDDDGDGIIDTIDWSIGGDNPNDGERFYVTYDVNRSFEGELFATEKEVFYSNTYRIDTA